MALLDYNKYAEFFRFIGGVVYSRSLKKTPKKIVRNGKVNFGTFSGVTEHLDIRGIRAPFAGIPTAKFFSNFRIKSRLFYFFKNENYIGFIEFFDDKVFGLAEVNFWNIETSQRLSYHSFMGPRRRFIPTNTSEASCNTFGKNRNIKISWSRRFKKVVMSFTVRGDTFRPASKGKFISHFTEEYKELLTVNPAPTTQRCSATWFLPMEINGGIGTAKHRKDIKELPQEKGQALLMMNRTYLKMRCQSESMVGFFEVDNKKVLFSFSSTNQDAIDEDTFNNNMLSLNGDISAMPPVCITHPFGIEKKWVVQDTEGMVDLCFMPSSIASRTLNIILMRNACTTIYGNFEGVLLSKDGEQIVLKNCPGIVTKSTLRL